MLIQSKLMRTVQRILHGLLQVTRSKHFSGSRTRFKTWMWNSAKQAVHWWLTYSTPWKIWVRQIGSSSQLLGKKKMFQTTNQFNIIQHVYRQTALIPKLESKALMIPLTIIWPMGLMVAERNTCVSHRPILIQSQWVSWMSFLLDMVSFPRFQGCIPGLPYSIYPISGWNQHILVARLWGFVFAKVKLRFLPLAKEAMSNADQC